MTHDPLYRSNADLSARRTPNADVELAWRAFLIVAGLVGTNALFNVLVEAVGSTGPRMSFLSPASDRFADLFKVVLSYPGGSDLQFRNSLGLGDLLRHYAANNDYVGFAAGEDRITHFHLTPLSTLLSLLSVRVLRVVDAAALLFALSGVVVLATAATARLGSSSWRAALPWTGALLLSYPMLLLVTRGNFFAAIAAFGTVAAVLLVALRRAFLSASLLLALAVNIRPNAVILALAVLLLSGRERWRVAATFCAAAAAILGASYWASNLLYPDYTPANMLEGLDRYHRLYVVGDAGLAFGSSLLGGLKALFGYRAGFELAGLGVMSAIIVATAVLRLRGQLGRADTLFLLTAAYCLGSQVFADYHLLVFAGPLLLGSLDRAGLVEPHDTSSFFLKPAVVTSCLMLVPRNYDFLSEGSAQILINPLLLLAGTVAVLAFSLRRSRHAGPT